MGGASKLSACIVTMGCAKNEVDSASMAERLVAAGAEIADDPEIADVIIVNTCSFIQSATEESLDMIFQMAGLEHVERGDAAIVVAGCMPARYGDDLSDALKEVKTFVPCSKEDDIVSIVASLFPGKQLRFTGESEYGRCTGQALMSGSGVSAYVKISDGCDRFCSYCTIPFIRGRYHSFPYEDIRHEVARHVQSGCREIVLIAQDTGRWGQDFEGQLSLAWLMDALATEFENTWFRVMYLQPEGVTDELVECMASHDNIASYLDIPLQHVDSSILKNMNRSGGYEQYLDLVESLRERIEGIVLRTTLIAGYPGETELQFEMLCNFLEETCFDYVGVFPYSCEEGTRAAKLDGQIDEQIKIDRAQMLRDIADSLSEARIRERIGSKMDVLVLGEEEDGAVYGRSLCQAPDVDGVIYLPAGQIGDIVNVTITDTLMYEMEGE